MPVRQSKNHGEDTPRGRTYADFVTKRHVANFEIGKRARGTWSKGVAALTAFRFRQPPTAVGAKGLR